MPERLAERYLNAVRAGDHRKAAECLTKASAGYEFPDIGDPIAGADYTVLGGTPGDGETTVECHALLQLRSVAVAERRFLLCVVGQGGAMRIDLDRSAMRTREWIARRVVGMNERAIEAGASGDIARMQSLIAQARALSEESDLELSGLGLNPDEPFEDIDTDSDQEDDDRGDAEPPPPETAEDRALFFAELTAQYWRARTANDGSAAWRETVTPMHASGFDVSRAGEIWDSVTKFHEAFSEPGEWSGGVTVRTLVESSRGPFVVLTAFLQEGAIWRIDHNTSLNATAHWWLRLYSDMHPFHPESSPRAAAMRFWHWTQMHSCQRAMEYVAPEGRSLKIPGIGRGEVWEFFFYLDQKVDEAGAKAMVRVLINASNLVRIVHTPMVLRDGVWLVDLPRVLRQLPSPQ